MGDLAFPLVQSSVRRQRAGNESHALMGFCCWTVWSLVQVFFVRGRFGGRLPMRIGGLPIFLEGSRIDKEF